MHLKVGFATVIFLMSYNAFSGNICKEILVGASCSSVPAESEAYRMCCSRMGGGSEDQEKVFAQQEEDLPIPGQAHETLKELSEFLQSKAEAEEELSEEQLDQVVQQLRGLKYNKCKKRYRKYSNAEIKRKCGQAPTNPSTDSSNSQSDDCVIHEGDQSRICNNVTWRPENRLGEKDTGEVFLQPRQSLLDIEAVLGETPTPDDSMHPDDGRAISK